MIYLRDSGLLHRLLDLPDRGALLGHPGVGASWEGFALEQVLRAVSPAEAFHWGTHGGAQLDLMFALQGRRHGVEFKFREAPSATRSMRAAMEDLALTHLWLVYPGSHSFAIDERITAWPLRDVGTLPQAMRGATRPRRR